LSGDAGCARDPLAALGRAPLGVAVTVPLLSALRLGLFVALWPFLVSWAWN
jgi:hypothetical protein